MVCVTLSEEHKGHQCIPLEEYMETCKEEIVQVCNMAHNKTVSRYYRALICYEHDILN